MSNAVLPSLQELSRLYKRSGVDCPLVLMTRVREPLDYYLSFYRWGVAFRQRADPVRGLASMPREPVRLSSSPPAGSDEISASSRGCALTGVGLVWA